MAYHLVVRSPFDGRAVGEHITDAATVGEILADHREAFVVKIAAPDATPVDAEPAVAIDATAHTAHLSE